MVNCFLLNRFAASWYAAIDCPSVSMQVSSPLCYYIYRTCFSYNEDVLRDKFSIKFYWKVMIAFEGRLKSVTLGYHSCQPHIAKLYQKTPLVFNYCRQKTIFYNSIGLDSGGSADFRVKPVALIKEHPSYYLSEATSYVTWDYSFFVRRKLILQMCMRSHPVELDVWYLVGPFVYFHISCVGTAKADAQSCLSLRWSPM